MRAWQDIDAAWFGRALETGAPDGAWWTVDEAFDSELRRRFESWVTPATAGAMRAWEAHPDSAAALIVLLDQIPRNLYRGDPRSWASDAAALAAARRVIAAGHDCAVHPLKRVSFYMPFVHAEDLDAQEAGVRAIEGFLADTRSGAAPPELEGFVATCLDHAHRHRHVIARFGRFVHRDAVLGRLTSEEERAFLAAHPSGF